MKKRSFLIFLLILTLCFSCLHGCSFNHEPQTDPTDISNKLDTPIGHDTSGAYEYDEYEDYIVLTAFTGSDSVVRVPGEINQKPVAGFGTIFAKNFKLTTVTIPGSVRSIDERAFYMCDHLTTVSISDGLQSIGKEAFAGCSSLSIANIPASVTSIADDAFLYCMNLVIFGAEGSAVQKYADRFQSINFRTIEPATTAAAVEEDSSVAEPEETSETTTEKETTTKKETTTAETQPTPEPQPEPEPQPVPEPQPETTTETPPEELTTIPDDSLDV